MTDLNINQIALTMAEKVSSEIDIKIAIIAAVGVMAGSFITILGQWFLEWRKTSPQRKLDTQRKQYLKKMLNDPQHEWRKIETLSRVIGATEEETKRLLIDIGARGSEKENDVWGLINKNPLP